MKRRKKTSFSSHFWIQSLQGCSSTATVYVHKKLKRSKQKRATELVLIWWLDQSLVLSIFHHSVGCLARHFCLKCSRLIVVFHPQLSIIRVIKVVVNPSRCLRSWQHDTKAACSMLLSEGIDRTMDTGGLANYPHGPRLVDVNNLPRRHRRFLIPG